MQWLEEVEVPETVDVIGPSNELEASMMNLKITTYCAVITSANGIWLLGIFPNHHIGFGKGKALYQQTNALLLATRWMTDPGVMVVTRGPKLLMDMC